MISCRKALFCMEATLTSRRNETFIAVIAVQFHVWNLCRTAAVDGAKALQSSREHPSLHLAFLPKQSRDKWEHLSL